MCQTFFRESLNVGSRPSNIFQEMSFRFRGLPSLQGHDDALMLCPRRAKATLIIEVNPTDYMNAFIDMLQVAEKGAVA